jgi:hypothetical protein
MGTSSCRRAVSSVWKRWPTRTWRSWYPEELLGKQTDDVDTLTYEGCGDPPPITQPMRNKRPAVKAARTTETGYEQRPYGHGSCWRIPAPTHNVPDHVQHGWSGAGHDPFQECEGTRCVCVDIWQIP